MWIVNPGIGEGGGVLFDKQSKLAVTNAHVTDTSQAVDVYFPAPDENGKLIKERDFYLKSLGVLKDSVITPKGMWEQKMWKLTSRLSDLTDYQKPPVRLIGISPLPR